MGYLTDYTIRIVDGEGDIDAICDSLDRATYYSFYTVEDEVYLSDAKWYGYEDDVRDVSAQFPDLLLEVEGSGEEYPDIWAQRFRSGKAGQRIKAVISFPGLGDVR